MRAGKSRVTSSGSSTSPRASGVHITSAVIRHSAVESTSEPRASRAARRLSRSFTGAIFLPLRQRISVTTATVLCDVAVAPRLIPR
eukprot:CAMPEP_0172175254 /NCGR_PEP_ID=MMETSP1050-20130122/14118_1 /TAXON_ID=233186 /ORGANISM="Cryptomonas curvata, Strain CCAP979/52" /LENGTH=85 /DNA_ID=CAMNT_0012847321 /DNA_START=155 /DNA_END=409 /DNA_ORIENTATION=-